MKKISPAFLTLISTIFITISSLADTAWVQDTFEDFDSGHLGNAGNDIYLTRDGEIQTIHRYDLNQDGYLDLVFNSTHDRTHHIPPTLAEIDTDGQISWQELEVLGSKAAVVDDFNRDGYDDLVFMPNGQNVQGAPRYFLTIIYGGPDGWPASRAQRPLPLYAPSAMETADLNMDGWPDLVFAETQAWKRGQPEGYILRVFWGSEDGFKIDSLAQFGTDKVLGLAQGDFDLDGSTDVVALTESQTIQVLYAKEKADQDADWALVAHALTDKDEALNLQSVTSADIDGDNQADLVFSSSEPTLYTLMGKPDKNWGKLQAIKAFPATQVTVGDLDEDGKPELVLTDLKLTYALGGETGGAVPGETGSVRILWAGPDGYSADRILELDIPSAIHTVVGDVNGDDHPDLAVAIYQGAVTMETDSLLFFGTGERKLERAATGIPTIGATQVVIVNESEDGPGKILFTNSLFATVGEAVPVYVYWGGAKGFSPENRWEIPNRSGYESSAADLNNDGHVDFIFLNSGHAGPEVSKSDPELGAHIFWGGEQGKTPGPNKFDKARSTTLNEISLGSSNIADLNRDGYLDLVFGAFESSDSEDTHLVIYYGSANGYDADGRQAIPITGRCISPLAADLNGDGWLDLTVVSFGSDMLWTYYGGPDGFSEDNYSGLYVPSPIDIEAADLNADGQLDIIASSYYDKTSGIPDMGNHIFWGNKKGYSPTNSQWLPGMATVGPLVADFDGDGYLDLFCPNYQTQGTREYIPSYLYWGGPDGLSPRNRRYLIANSGHDAQAADFNRDGLLDLVVSEHSTNNGHLIESKIFYNDGNRFADPETTSLPTIGTHWMWQQDMGNLYHRRFEETYTSKEFTWDHPSRKGALVVKSDAPSGSSLEIQVRSAETSGMLSDAPWRDVSKNAFSLDRQDRVLQYRLVFHSRYGDIYPSVDSVKVSISN